MLGTIRTGMLSGMTPTPGITPTERAAWTDESGCDNLGRDMIEDATDRALADHVITQLNPPPDPAAVELSRCVDAVTVITDYVAALPCSCPQFGTDGVSCGRCSVLGRYADAPVEW